MLCDVSNADHTYVCVVLVNLLLEFIEHLLVNMCEILLLPGCFLQYYTSPMSGYTFTSKMETLHYLFTGLEERMLELQASAEDNELHVSQFLFSHAIFFRKRGFI